MTGGPDRYFLDTNILVYAHDRVDQRKQMISERLILGGVENNTAVLSTQVLNEWFVTMTQKVKPPLSAKVARKEIILLRALDIVEVNYEMILEAIDLQMSKKTSFWDALIVAAALASECHTLYTEDLQHGQKMGSLKIVNPFKSKSPDLVS